MKTSLKSISLMIGASLLLTSAFADPTIINNYNNAAPSRPSAAPAPTNNAPSGPAEPTDPRVPPAGVYSTQTGNSSSQTLYTTGETKPYIVDPPNNNSNNMPPVVQPYINPPGPRRR